jgi:hypothetical protein
MSDLLEKIGLVRYDRIEIPVAKHEFVKILSANLDDPQYNLFGIFSKDPRPYKGVVNEYGFKIWRKRKMLDTRFTIARAIGMLTEDGRRLMIDLRLIGYSPLLVIGFLLGGLFYVFAIALMLMNRHAPGWVVPVIAAHGALMASIPIIGIRKNLRHTRDELERDLYFMMRDAMHAERRTDN